MMEKFGSEAEGEHHLRTPPTPAAILNDLDEDRVLEAVNFFNLPTPDLIKTFQFEITSSSASSKVSSGQVTTTESVKFDCCC